MGDINVVSRTQRIHVDMAASSVAVINAGPQGPAGPIGEVSDAELTAGLATKVSKAGDTMTGNLNLIGSTPRLDVVGTNAADVWLTDSGSTENQRKYLIRVDTNALQIRGLTDAAANTYSFVVFRSGTGQSDFSGSSSVRVPAISGANQAAQVTAYDAATGRLAIGGHEIGDTGWRRITSWDAAGVVIGEALGSLFSPVAGQAGFADIRRIGDVCYLRLMRLNKTHSARIQLWNTFTLPNGFRHLSAYDSGPWVAVDALTVANSWAVSFAGSNTRLDIMGPIFSMGGATLTLSWPAQEVWPTSLPGIAV